MNWDRLLSLLERYVVVQERTLALNEERVADMKREQEVRRELDARAVAASERLAEGRLTVQGELKGDMVQRHRVPVPDDKPTG